jgi:hypothetical protein
MTYSGSVVLEKIFKWSHPIFCIFKNYLPFEEYLNNLEFPLRKDDLYQVWLTLAYWFWRRRFFFNINICWHGFPYCGPSRPPGIMIWRILNLHYIRKLSCKYELFGLSGSGEGIWTTPPHFCTFVIISPLMRTWPFIWTNYNSLYPRIICTKFDWTWPAGSGEDDFKKFSVYFYSFAIISPQRRANPLHLKS